MARSLPFTYSNKSIKTFRHALSLDERRVRFKPSSWYRPTCHDLEQGVKKNEMPRSTPHHRHTRAGWLAHHEHYFSEPHPETDVEEVWFAGCHCDVGGGSVANGTRNSLARIPLRWMIRQCFLKETGIMFHKHTFTKVGLDPNTLYPEVLPKPPTIFQDPIRHTIPVPEPLVIDDHTVVLYTDGGSFVNEAEEDLADALSPIYDQLGVLSAFYWWILEWIPQRVYYQSDTTDLMVSRWKVNMASGRHIPMQKKHGVKMHRTVEIRMKAKGLPEGQYRPKAILLVDPEWVD